MFLRNIKSRLRTVKYNITASMSSSFAGAQAYINKAAPDADYQGCCLHSLNLVKCSSCKILAVQNMFDSCQKAYYNFRNFLKRQQFLKLVIQSVCPVTKKVKVNGLCKTKWVERHNTFSTILYSCINFLLKHGMKFATLVKMISFIVK